MTECGDTVVDLVEEQIRIAYLGRSPLGLTDRHEVRFARPCDRVPDQCGVIRSRISAPCAGDRSQDVCICRAETVMRDRYGGCISGYTRSARGTIPCWQSSLCMRQRSRRSDLERMRSALGELVIEGIDDRIRIISMSLFGQPRLLQRQI